MGRPLGVVSPKKVSRIGCIIVTSMRIRDDSDIQVVMSLSKFNLDICGLSQVRWSGNGTKNYPSTRIGSKKIVGYTIHFSGNEKSGRYGVGIAVKDSLTSSISAWEPVNDRLIWMRFNEENTPITIVQCYAPTDTSVDSIKDFYQGL